MPTSPAASRRAAALHEHRHCLLRSSPELGWLDRQAQTARDVLGRPVLAEVPGDTRRLDMVRAYCSAACACASPASGMAGGMPLRELFRLLLSTVRCVGPSMGHV